MQIFRKRLFKSCSEVKKKNEKIGAGFTRFLLLTNTSLCEIGLNANFLLHIYNFNVFFIFTFTQNDAKIVINSLECQIESMLIVFGVFPCVRQKFVPWMNVACPKVLTQSSHPHFGSKLVLSYQIEEIINGAFWQGRFSYQKLEFNIRCRWTFMHIRCQLLVCCKIHSRRTVCVIKHKWKW